MKYKFIGEDEHMFHVQHPDGSEFSIAKHAVGEQVHKRIKALEPVKMAEGGEVPDLAGNPEGAVGPELTQTDDASAEPQVGDLGQYFEQPQAAPIAQPQAPVVGSNPPLNPADQSGIPSLSQSQENALSAQESGIKNIAATQSKTYEDISKAQQNMATQAAAIDAELKKTTAPLEAENQNLFNSVKDAKIEPNRLWHNMGTGNKVLAAISIGLSGLGAGLQGPGAKNMALEVIDKSIDRDIDSQKSDLGKKQTLFSENLRRLGDARSAAAATKMQMLTITQAQISSMMAKANSAEALQRGQMGMAEIELKKAELKNQIGIKQLAQNGGNLDPSLFVQHLVPKEQQKEVFHEIKQAQDARKNHDELMKAFDEASKDVGLTTIRTPPSILKMRAMMLPIIHDEEGRVNEFEQKTTNDLEPARTDLGNHARLSKKRDAYEKFIFGKSAAPVAKGFGIDLDKFGSTSTQQQQYKVVNGVKYMRGPNGEAIAVQ